MTKLSDRLEALAEKATKGPWECLEQDPDASIPIVASNLGGWVASAMPWPTEVDCGGSDRIANNAAMIVELVNNLPTILQALKDKDL